MTLSKKGKRQIQRELVDRLKGEPEVRKVVIFGSFPQSDAPNDLDVAIFQDSDETYLPLAMKYRRLLRIVADRIPLDVFPMRSDGPRGWFFDEVERGQVVYDRGRRCPAQ
jgi:predicted nucleotidyltransferase